MSTSDNAIKKLGWLDLTAEQKETALRMAAEGRAIQKIGDAINFNACKWLELERHDPAFAKEFADARFYGLEYLADGLIDIVDDYQDVQKARVKSENIRFLLSKRKPHVYGDRIDVNLNQTVDIKGALAEAEARVLAARSVGEIVSTRIEQQLNSAREHDTDTILIEHTQDTDKIEKA